MFNSRTLYPVLHHGHTGFCGHNDLPNLRQEHVLEAAVWSQYIRTEKDLSLRVCPGHGQLGRAKHWAQRDLLPQTDCQGKQCRACYHAKT